MNPEIITATVSTVITVRRGARKAFLTTRRGRFTAGQRKEDFSRSSQLAARGSRFDRHRGRRLDRPLPGHSAPQASNDAPSNDAPATERLETRCARLALAPGCDDPGCGDHPSLAVRNDGMAWRLFPLLLIVPGRWTQALGILVIAVSWPMAGFASGVVLLGLGTATVSPTLLAAIGDVAHPTRRASSVGVYRPWRDQGYAVGALLAGATADAFGLTVAALTVAGLTLASGVVVAVRMRETRAPRDGLASSSSVRSAAVAGSRG